jgi:hypothetical protein
MSGKRLPWETILALLIGIALGLLYAWVISPVAVVDAIPSALRADFKDQYRAVIAAAYAADGNLTRAQSRLALLGDVDSRAALSAQAQRTLSSGDALQSYQLAQLASAFQGVAPTEISITPTGYMVLALTPTTSNPPLTNPTETVLPIETDIPLPFFTATPRATRTPTPKPGGPFKLLEQETVCDESLSEGLLQVFTITSNNRRQIPGIELILSWAGGEEHFFTGFKPELGNGYADARMQPGVSYTLRAADGGAFISELTPPVCQRKNGETYYGGLKITLHRP